MESWLSGLKRLTANEVRVNPLREFESLTLRILELARGALNIDLLKWNEVMKFILNHKEKHFLILGAGASADYGLPTWIDLVPLVIEKINDDKENRYNYKSEMLDWLNKIGDTPKPYKTIDQCMQIESVENKADGLKIEDEMFSILAEIFDEKFEEDEDKEYEWINILNMKILANTNLATEIAFVNFNYDGVLYENFLQFRYLSDKERTSLKGPQLERLTGVKAFTLYPHSYLFSKTKKGDFNRLDINSDTVKIGNGRAINATSCYDKPHEPHSIQPRIYTDKAKLYILGLGGGLEYNLNNLNFSKSISISEIHVTITKKGERDKVKKFLTERYGVSMDKIKDYTSCKELINACFNT